MAIALAALESQSARQEIVSTKESSSTTVVCREAAWSIIAPFFQPPPELVGKLGDYRSPLLSRDNTRATMPADWPRHRAETLHDWNELMRPWPKVIEHPKLEVLQ